MKVVDVYSKEELMQEIDNVMEADHIQIRLHNASGGVTKYTFRPGGEANALDGPKQSWEQRKERILKDVNESRKENFGVEDVSHV